MTRKTITVNVDIVSPHDWEGTLKQVRARIDELIEQHGEGARLDWNAYYYYRGDESPTPRFEVQVTRPETDEEIAVRLAGVERDRLAQEARERKEYERLQAKFKDSKVIGDLI